MSLENQCCGSRSARIRIHLVRWIRIRIETNADPQHCLKLSFISWIRMFTKDKLNQTAVTEKWNLVKVVCTQPFSKHIQVCLKITVIADQELTFRILYSVRVGTRSDSWILVA
jgi:hypothetical protein